MKVAITGGIGSGKSAVLSALVKMGKPVYDADRINAELLTDETYLEKLRKNFPAAFLGGNLCKSKLAEMVFSSDEKRQILNALAHPAIISKIESLDDCYVEVPLLVESGAQKLFDKVITVVAPKEVKLARLKDRSGLQREQAERIMAAQATDDERIKISDFVIVNDSDLQTLEKAVFKIAETISI